MSFLNDIMEPQGRCSNIQLPSAVGQDQQEYADNDGKSSSCAQDCLDLLKNVSQSSMQTTSPSGSSTSTHDSRKRKKVYRPEVEAMVKKNEALIDIVKHKLELLLREANKEDDDLLFLKSLLPDIKSLPRSRKIGIRLEFQEIIYNEIQEMERFRNAGTFIHTGYPLIPVANGIELQRHINTDAPDSKESPL